MEFYDRVLYSSWVPNVEKERKQEKERSKQSDAAHIMFKAGLRFPKYTCGVAMIVE